MPICWKLHSFCTAEALLSSANWITNGSQKKYYVDTHFVFYLVLCCEKWSQLHRILCLYGIPFSALKLFSNKTIYMFIAWMPSLLFCFLTLLSPAVMFCRAPAAASRVVVFVVHCWRILLYRPTTLGCHSHSHPLGTLATSVNVDRSWFWLWV